MSGFQNTRQKFKDAAGANASTTLVSFHVLATKNAASGTIKAGEFLANGASGAANVASLVPLTAKVTIGGTNGGSQNFNTLVAAAQLTLNYSNGVSLPANTAYGLVIDHDIDTGATRAAAPTAFISFGEGSAGSNPTKFLFEVGRTGKLVNATAVSGAAVYNANSVTIASANGSFTVRVNGTTKFLPLFDTLASNASNFA